MGYSTNPLTLEEIRPHLAAIEKGEPTTYVVEPPMTAAKWAYRIREAFYIAKRYALRYPQLATASQKFKVQVVGENRVAVLPKDSYVPELVVSSQALPRTVIPLKLERGTDQVQTIIETIQQDQTRQSYRFETVLSKESLIRLLLWCQQTSPRRILLVSDTELTLPLATDSLTPDIEWSPDDD